MASKRPGSALAYAESEDGIHWTKPFKLEGGQVRLRFTMKNAKVKNAKLYAFQIWQAEGAM